MFDPATEKDPRKVEAYLRQAILSAHGDKIENQSDVIASRGYYSVHLELGGNKAVWFNNFRKKDAKRIAKSIRALKA